MYKKRILLVVPLPPPYHGSNLMNQYVANCKELGKRYKIKVLPLHYATDIADIGEINLRKIIVLIGYLARTLRFLKTFRPHAVYFVPAITGFSFYRDCLFALIFKYLKVNVIYHLHGKGIKHKLHSPLQKKMYRWFFKDTTIIHLSSMLYEDLKEVVSYEQCKFLANGIEDISLHPIDKVSDNARKPTILFISNLLISKGPLVLLDACKILMSKGLEFKTYFVGNPSMELNQEFFANTVDRMGLQDYVEYLGPLYGKEKYEIFRKSDVLAFPTQRDTFPLVLLEAMAASLPVVSTREGSIPEIVDDGITGYIVDKQNPMQLSEKIEFLILNPDQRQKMGLAARRKFERKYTINVFYKNLVQIFDSLM